jgi:nucleoside-diphosphate-sugar epimerase
VNSFANKRVLITGATGLIGNGLVHHLMKFKNVHVVAVSRSERKLRKCFSRYQNNPNFSLVAHDVSLPFSFIVYPIDFIFHAASPQENKVISESPVDVINANLLGTINCLDVLRKQEIAQNVKGRLILFSSVTVYGNNTNKNLVVKEGDTSVTDIIESNGAPYSQSKRMAEVIVRAYAKQFGVDVVISRLSTVYGDAIIKTDTAFFEFIKKAVSGKNIQLRNTMLPRRDNIYLDDAISGLLTIALKGKTNEAYNISSNGELENFLAVDEIARIIADEANRRVGTARAPINVIYGDCTKGKRKPGVILDNSKLKKLGWILSTSINDGIAKTFDSCNFRNT